MGSVRDFVYSISPPWLQRVIANKLLYIPGLGMDFLIEKMQEGMLAHMPGYGDPSALPLTGADRGIVQGPSEAATSYATRQQFAWDDWGYAGAPRANLRETLSYLLPLTPAGTEVSASSLGGVWNQYLVGDNTKLAPSHQLVAPNNWDWDSAAIGGSPATGALVQWWRCFLIFFSVAPNAPWTSKGLMGASGLKMGQSGNAMGVNQPTTLAQGIVSILGNWDGGHAYFPWVILSFDSTLFQTTGSLGGVNPGVNPDGNWGRWSKIVNGQYVAARSSSARYANGPS